MTTDFGNTLADVRRVSVFGGILGTIVGVLFICVGYAHGTLTGRWPTLVFGTLFIAALAPFAVLLTSAFSIRLDEHRVTHLFLGRFVLSQHPLAHLVTAEFFGRPFPVVLRFSDNSCIHFIGAHLSVISALRERLAELRPDLAL